MKRCVVIGLLVILAACSPRIKKTTVSYYDSVEVYNSGGFTATSTGYVIQKNGEIYLLYHFPNKPYQQKFYRQASMDSVNMVFSRIKESGVEMQQYDRPGNLTYAIKLQKDSSVHELRWADGQDSAKTYMELYRYLRAFASGKN